MIGSENGGHTRSGDARPVCGPRPSRPFVLTNEGAHVYIYIIYLHFYIIDFLGTHRDYVSFLYHCPLYDSHRTVLCILGRALLLPRLHDDENDDDDDDDDGTIGNGRTVITTAITATNSKDVTSCPRDTVIFSFRHFRRSIPE